MIRRLTALAAFLSIAGAAFAHPPSNSAFVMRVLVNDTPRQEYRARGNVYIEALRGSDYALRLTNPTPYRVAVALSVDGLNTIDATHTDAWDAPKWVLAPFETVVISGWQVNQQTARRFFFTGEKQSYGAALGMTENLGVIEAVCYRERPRPIAVFDPPVQSENAAGSSPPEAVSREAAPREAAAQSKTQTALADEYAATGMGGRTAHSIEMVSLELEREPIAKIRIRYEYRPQLVKLGIVPDRTPLERREQARGFEQYCPEP